MRNSTCTRVSTRESPKRATLNRDTTPARPQYYVLVVSLKSLLVRAVMRSEIAVGHSRARFQRFDNREKCSDFIE